MRYALLFPLFSFAVVQVLSAQNLVPDPGFEIFNQDCTGHPALEHWFSPNTATPDLYSLVECDNLLTESLMNELGVPYPYEGQSYVGMYCCKSLISSQQTREYVTTELISELQAGITYRISYQLSRKVYFDLAIDRIGIYLSEHAPFFDTPIIIPVEPQIETSGTILTPDLEWMQVEHAYLATGGERFITIGNFRHPNDMLWVDLDISPFDSNSGYYLFDDIKLEVDEGSIVTVNSGQEARFDARMQSLLDFGETGRYNLHSVQGSLISSGIVNPESTLIPIGSLPQGIYLLSVNGMSKSMVLKIWKE